jgi:hypothetical protein
VVDQGSNSNFSKTVIPCQDHKTESACELKRIFVSYQNLKFEMLDLIKAKFFAERIHKSFQGGEFYVLGVIFNSGNGGFFGIQFCSKLLLC